ncbi:MAG: hypothetical protein GKR95_16110 [Gammaproteobacteria bacterium]|nr:hypothetical protein [Gammaproteobacteria bacterium]
MISEAPRGPYCMMGVCFECLVEIDGKRNQQACQIEVQPGMSVLVPTPGEAGQKFLAADSDGLES